MCVCENVCVCVRTCVCVCLFVCFFVCLFVCLSVCLFVLDMTVTLHSTAQYTESTALPNYGLAQAWLKPGSSGTRNSTDTVRRCTVTDRLA